MSKASKQALTLLYSANGTLTEMIGSGKAEDNHVLELAEELAEKLLHTVVTYPVTGDRAKHRKWASQKLVEWGGKLSESEIKVEMGQLFAVINFLIHDLYQKTSNKKAVYMLEKLLETMYCIQYTINYECDDFEAYEDANKLVNLLYETIGFEQ